MLQIAQIIGGSGTGKTRELMACLDLAVQRLHDPHLIGFVSFTRAACDEAADRAADMLNMKRADLRDHGWFKTLHGVCYRLLGVEKELLTDTAADRTWLQEALQCDVKGTAVEKDAEHLDVFEGATSNAERALALWGTARNRLHGLRPTWEAADECDDRTPDYQECVTIVERYEQAKRLDHRLDFVDLLARFSGWRLRIEGPDKCEPDGEVPKLECWLHDECLPGDSRVTLEDGTTRSIKEIVEGRQDIRVLTLNHHTGNIEPKRVVRWHVSPLRKRAILKIRNLSATEDHPVWTSLGYYATMKKVASVLRYVAVLELDHEKLRSERPSLRNGGVDYRRVATWRCVYHEESGAQRECASKFSSRKPATPISLVETQDAQPLGTQRAIRTNQDGIWVRGLRLSDEIPSGLYGDLAESASRRPKDGCVRVASVSDTYWLGRLVYGRRQFRREFGSTFHIRLSPFGISALDSVVSKNVWLDIPNEQIKGTGNPCSLWRQCSPFLQDHCPPRHSFNAIQGRYHLVQQGRTNLLSQKGASLSSNPERAQVHRMWQSLRCREVGSNVQQGLSAIAKHRTPPAISETTGDNFWNVCNLRQTVHGASQKTIQSQSSDSDLLTLLPRELGSEESVYCLGVEDNENFFADGILVHNCQDSSALLDSCFRRLIDAPSVRWVYLAGDPYQSIFGFAGSDHHFFLDYPTAKRRIMPKSWRCKQAILALGEDVLRDCTDYWDRGIQPAGPGGNVEERDWNDGWVDDLDPRQSWLLLARTNFHASRIARRLDENGVPWLPTRRDVGCRWKAPVRNVATRALLNLEVGSPIDGDEWRAILAMLPSKAGGVELLARGTKAEWAAMNDKAAIERVGWTVPEDLERLGGTPALIEIIRTRQWRGLVDHADGYAMAVDRWGQEAVDSPKIQLSTVHGAKGREAENVAVLTTISEPCVRATQTDAGADEEARVKYVALTRAKSRLLIVKEAKTRFRWKLPV